MLIYESQRWPANWCSSTLAFPSQRLTIRDLIQGHVPSLEGSNNRKERHERDR
jgi:hypothetical protein